MKKVFFIRNTHDENGEPRKEVLDKISTREYQEKENRLNCEGLGVHGLNRSQTRTTLDQYIDEHFHYASCFPDYIVPSVEVLLEELVQLIKEEFVKVEIEEE